MASFDGKRIAVIGLGPHGEMIEDVKFLIKSGAFVSLYDMKSEARLKANLILLRSIGLANYVCGSVPVEDLVDMDIIILGHEYSRESTFLASARAKNIPIEYPETLFFKLSPPLTLLGVMGLCGKSSVISMLEPMLLYACKELEKDGVKQNVFTFDHETKNGILAFLKKAKTGDLVLMRLTPFMMAELHHMRISPHVAIFTTPLPVESQSGLPFEILAFQTYNNFIIASDDIIDNIKLYKVHTKAKMLRTKSSIVPAEWDFGGWGFEKENAALALQAARLFKVPDEYSRDVLEKWKPLKGRLELVKKGKNIEYYNDAASVSPFSTISSLYSITEEKNVILILGGAESGLNYSKLYEEIPKFVHTLILLPGSGTIRERKSLQGLLDVNIASAPNTEEAVAMAKDMSKTGDKILFSPGFAIGGFDISRKERGERFIRALRSLF